MTEVTYFVAGDPAPQGSKSQTRTGHMYESSQRVKPWREAVASESWAASLQRGHKGRLLFAGDVEVILTFNLRIDADTDKLVRAVFDGITQGGLWVDDKLVVRVDAVKNRRTEPHGCTITVRGVP